MAIAKHHYVTLALLAATACQAEEIRGRVLDSSHAAVPRAWVTLYSQSGPDARNTRSSDSGDFAFAQIPPGAYLLSASAAGFAQSPPLRLRLEGGQTASLDIVLDVSRVAHQVTITASGTPLSVDSTAKAITVLDAASIERREEFSLSEVLRQVPGMRVQQLGGPGAFTRLHTRGLRSSDTAVLIDGFRFRDAGAPQGDASAFLSDLLVVNPSRVEVLRGSGSSLYGTHAIAGVVQVVTDPGGGPLHGEVSAEGGGLGMFRGLARMGGGALDSRLQFSAGLTHLNVTRGVDGSDQARNTSGQGSLQYALRGNTRLSARLFATDAYTALNSTPFAGPDANLPPSGLVPAIPLASGQMALADAGLPYAWGNATFAPSLNDPDASRKAREVSSLLSLTHNFTPATTLRLGYQALTTSRDNFDGPGGASFQPLFNNNALYDGRIDNAQARVDSQWGKRHLLTAGYEFERERFTNLATDQNPDPASRVFARARVSEASHSVFAQDQARFFDSRLLVSLSARWQGFSLNQPKFEGGAPVYGTGALSAPPDAFTGDGAVAWMARAGTKLRAHVGNAYRAPALYERFGASFYNGSFFAYGDPRLRPERSIAVDGGVDQYFANSRLRVSATYFYTRLQSVIAFGALQLGLDPFDRFSGYLNTRGGLARGFETSAEASLIRGMSISGSYTYTRSQERTPVFSGGLLLSPRIPRHLATILITKRFGKRLDVTSDIALASNSLTPFYTGTGTRAFVFPGARKADLAASYSILVRDRASLRLFARVDNFLNRTWYEDGFRVPKAWAVGGIKLVF
ncbi:MAG: Vitamin B12 transporter BtuB [Bryobacteraceae bacterium]|nr:Vitamin B12 transporter BtuB [Bryobacteraceae bacterium]